MPQETGALWERGCVNLVQFLCKITKEAGFYKQEAARRTLWFMCLIHREKMDQQEMELKVAMVSRYTNTLMKIYSQGQVFFSEVDLCLVPVKGLSRSQRRQRRACKCQTISTFTLYSTSGCFYRRFRAFELILMLIWWMMKSLSDWFFDRHSRPLKGSRGTPGPKGDDGEPGEPGGDVST